MVKLVAIVSNDPASKSTTYLADDGNTYTLKGDLSARANNPGNISPTASRDLYESQFGAIGYLPSSKGQPAVAVFPDFETGQAAQVYLWQTPAYQNKTLEQAAKSWASAPYVDALVKAAGVPKDTPVSALTPEQLNAVVSAQVGREGSGKLTITDSSGARVDPAVITGAHPVPPADIPNVTTNRAGPDDRPSMSSLYGPPPAPLISPAETTFGGRLPSLAMNGIDWLRADGVPVLPPTDFTTDQLGEVDPRLAGMSLPQVRTFDPIGMGPGTFATLQSLLPSAAPPLPIPRPSTLPVAPVPMPGRPPSLDATAAKAEAPHLVQLPSGKMVPVGTYPIASNPGSMSVITDDGTGLAKVQVVNPGFMNPAKMGEGTIAGSVLGQKLAEAGNQAKTAATNALNTAGSTVQGLGHQVQDLGGNIASGAAGLLNNLGGLFGGSSVPAPPNTSSSFLPSGSSWSASIPDVPAAPTVFSAAPSFAPQGSTWTTQQVANPAYAAWQAKYGSQDNTAGMTVGGVTVTGTSPNTVSSKFDGEDSMQMGTPPLPVVPAIPAPPPQYITQRVQVPLPRVVIPAPISVVKAAAKPAQAAPAYPNYAGGGPVTGVKQGTSGYTIYNGNNGVPGNSGNWFNQVTGRG